LHGSVKSLCFFVVDWKQTNETRGSKVLKGCCLFLIFFSETTANTTCNHFMVFNATFNNISAILWQSVLLVEETGEN
jgi:hypothetical protein